MQRRRTWLAQRPRLVAEWGQHLCAGRIPLSEDGKLEVGVPDTHEEVAAVLADELDANFTAGIIKLHGMEPHLKVQQQACPSLHCTAPILTALAVICTP